MVDSQWRRMAWIGVVLALFVGTGLVGQWTEKPNRPLSVLLLTVESLRFDAVSPETTPNLVRLAAEHGVRYTNHRAVSAWTGTNIVTLLTGWSPFRHGVHSRGQRPSTQHDLALEVIADHGWRVAGLQAFMRVPIFDGLGLGREGVDAAGDTGPGGRPDQPGRWLSARADDREPFVLWYHYLHTHLPYRPSDPFDVEWESLLPALEGEAATVRAERFRRLRTLGKIETGSARFEADDRPAVEALYLAGAHEFDAWFAQLWALLEDTGLIDNTVVVVTADHGEELLERGHVGHASTSLDGHLHEEIVRLPLFVFLPERVAGPAAGGVIARPSDHADLMATVFPLLGLDLPPGIDGADLRAVPNHRIWTGVTSKAGYSEPNPAQPEAMLFAAVDGPWKLHRVEPADGPSMTRLYDLAVDPTESIDRASAHPQVVARLGGAIEQARNTALPVPRAGAAVAAVGPRPVWRRPPGSGVYSFADVGGRFSLEWEGPADQRYVVEYRYLDGAGWLDGTLPVDGTQLDFGAIDRRYWDTWIVPNGPYRLRVGYAGSKANWSEWIELNAE